MSAKDKPEDPRKSEAAKKGWKKLGPITKQRKLVKELAKAKTPAAAVVAAATRQRIHRRPCTRDARQGGLLSFCND